MPNLREHDTPKRDPESFQGNPLHDALLSNPELREAYLEYEEEHGPDRAHYLARKDVFGEDWEPDNPEYYDFLKEPDVFEVEGTAKAVTNPFDEIDYDYEEIDDLLEEAHEKSVQWGVTEENPDLSKAPGIWSSDDEVPEFVLEALEHLIEEGDVVWTGGYARLPPSAEATIIETLEDVMTQPQGWSLGSLLDALRDNLGDIDAADVEDDYLLNILRNETSAVLNTAREEAYEGRPDSEEYEYDWIGPNDHRTTDTCLSIEGRIEDEGGAVSMERLKEILYEEALVHADEEGTPERADDWVPHHNCRRTFVRRVR